MDIQRLKKLSGITEEYGIMPKKDAIQAFQMAYKEVTGTYMAPEFLRKDQQLSYVRSIRFGVLTPEQAVQQMMDTYTSYTNGNQY